MKRWLLPLVACTGCFDFSTLTECNDTSSWVCDSFESGAPADAWTPFAPVATLSGTVDATRAHASKQALHITGAPGMAPDEWQLQWKDLPQTSGTSLFARAFVFLPAATTNTFAIFTAIQSTGSFSGLRVLIGGGNTLTIHNGITSADTDASATLPTAAWVCLEWQIDEANAGETTLWLDDAEIAHGTGDTQPPSPLLGQFGVGVVYQGTLTADPLEIWIDDVLLDDHRITCRQ